MLFQLCLESHLLYFFFFNDTATTQIYTLSLHDALPIYPSGSTCVDDRMALLPVSPSKVTGPTNCVACGVIATRTRAPLCTRDRKSTRLNSSHSQISYAVFCLKKKKSQ